jgi:predicted nucleotidyltransferase
MVDSQIRYDPQQLTEYCKKNNIRWMAVFGSAVRGDLRDESDLDILVEFRSYEGLGFFRFMKIQREIGYRLCSQGVVADVAILLVLIGWCAVSQVEAHNGSVAIAVPVQGIVVLSFPTGIL